MLQNYFDRICTLHPKAIGIKSRSIGGGLYHQVIPFFLCTDWYATGLFQHNIEPDAIYTVWIKRKYMTEYSSWNYIFIFLVTSFFTGDNKLRYTIKVDKKTFFYFLS